MSAPAPTASTRVGRRGALSDTADDEFRMECAKTRHAPAQIVRRALRSVMTASSVDRPQSLPAMITINTFVASEDCLSRSS